MPKIITQLGTDTKGFDKGAAHVKKRMDGLKKSAGLLKGAFGGAIAVLGAGRAVGAALDKFDRIGKLAGQLDIAPETVQRLDHLANLSGSDVETLGRFMAVLSQRVEEAGDGAAKFVGIFQDMGLSVEQLVGMGVEERFKAFATALQGMGSHTDKLNSLMAIGGSRARELLLTLTDPNVTKAMAEISVVSKENVEAIEAFNDAWATVKQTAQANTGMIIGEVLRLTEALNNATGGAVDLGKAFEIIFKPFEMQGERNAKFIADNMSFEKGGKMTDADLQAMEDRVFNARRNQKFAATQAAGAAPATAAATAAAQRERRDALAEAKKQTQLLTQVRDKDSSAILK